jgi:hypothetical protein
MHREKSVGSFSLDILAENQNNEKVIIENQLEKTDHTHLGQLLTYLIGLDASIAIWITKDPKPEHTKVIDWLNENTERSFYLVRIEAVRIGDSKPAPLFTIISQPNETTKEVGQEKKELAEKDHLRIEYWRSLLEKSNKKNSLFSAISPGHYHWIGAGAGKSGVTFNYVVTNDYVSAELYIDHDKDNGHKNKLIFDQLYKQKDEIEKDLGLKLEWERLDEKRASRIAYYIEGAGLRNRDEWPALQDKITEAMSKIEKVLSPYLKGIKI